HATSTENRNATMNSERQKTISQPSVLATLRTKIPPVLQQRPAATISSTPSRRLEGNAIGVLRAAAVVEREELPDDFAVARPGLAAVDKVRLLAGMLGDRRAGSVACLRPASHRLERDRRRRHQQLRDVRAALGSPDRLGDRAAPAGADSRA